MSKHASDSDRAGLCGEPMSAEGGFVFLIEDGIHSVSYKQSNIIFEKY
jgi:hypothetical protein